ncbi:MAG: glycosyltransferase family 2 protein [Candidatus Pacearchaeota archaeon]|nr:glycosyltransferase family 2 protein [Candidatus Pacearchaeota archaeon]
MKVLPIIYLIYMFVSIYLLSFFLILYLKNKRTLFDYPVSKKQYSVSFVVPAYNEGKTIGDTIEHIFGIDYKKIIQVIVVNDCSTDNTREIVEEMQKKYPNLILINNEKNLGNAGRSKNEGLKYAKGELIAFVDADSYPANDSLKKIIGFFDDEKVGAVTCPILVRERGSFIEKLQGIEYKVIAFTRKLLGYVDAIYVTPGPLAVYRKKAIDEIHGFDGDNMTEDIEITWNLTAHGWERRMCLSTEVTTTAPNTLKAWYKQRRRWGIGGIQCMAKYKKDFFKKGMLGMFVLPFFVMQFFLGLLGLGVFFYLAITKIISNYILVGYSIPTGVPLLTIDSLFITPSFLDYLGIILFVVGTIFTLFSLSMMKSAIFKKRSVFDILFFSIVYLSVYPFITLSAVYNYFKGGNKWR